jgi:hypothetical protein
MVYVMEYGGDETLQVTLRRAGAGQAGDSATLSMVVAYAYYQIVSLLERLGALLQFNHRDLHFENVLTTTLVDDGQRVCGRFPLFRCVLIDFGLSRITYNGRDILGSAADVFASNPVQAYNDGCDLVFAARMFRRKSGCVSNTTTPCAFLYDVLDRILCAILMSSGVNFDTGFHENHSRNILVAMTLVGDHDGLSRIRISERNLQGAEGPQTFAKTPAPARAVLNLRTVKALMVCVLRILKERCFAVTTGEDYLARIDELLARNVPTDAISDANARAIAVGLDE